MSAGRARDHAYDEEAEIGVLGSMILAPEVVSSVLEITCAGDFYRTPHATLFRVIDKMVQDEQAIDPVLVQKRLTDENLIDVVGGTSFISRVMQSVPTSANAVHYATIVRELARIRDVVHAADRYVEEARNGTEEEAYKALADARTRLVLARGGDPAGAAPLRWDLATQLGLEEPQPPVQLVERVFTRPTVNMVFGPPGSGKSFALLQTMLDLVYGGGAFLGFEEFQVRPDTTDRFSATATPEKCLWIFGSEDSKDRMDIRSRKVFKSGPHRDKQPEAGRFVYVTPPDDVFLGDARGWRWLDETVATEKPSVLVCDTVSSLISSSLDLTKHDHVATYLRHFHRYRDNQRITSFHVAHTRKASGDPKAMKEAKADTMLGSQAWRGLSDGLLLVHATDGDTDRVDIRILKSKDLEHPIPHLAARLDRTIGRFVPRDDDEEETPRSTGGRPASCTPAAVLRLRATHPDHVFVAQIPDAIGVSKSTWSHNSKVVLEELTRQGHSVENGVITWAR